MAIPIPSLIRRDIIFTVYLGGFETGSPVWGTAQVVTCDVLRWSDTNTSVSIDDTVPCDVLSQSLGIRANRRISAQLRSKASGLLFGTNVNVWVKFTYSIATTTIATSETMTCRLRTNNRTVEGDGRILNDIELEVVEVTAATAP